MILDVYGTRRSFVLWIGVFINIVVALERLNNIPQYNQTYAKFLIGCCWLRMIVYFASIFDLMNHEGYLRDTWLILSAVFALTYASSRYIDNRDTRMFSIQLKGVKNAAVFKSLIVVLLNEIREFRHSEDFFKIQGFLGLNQEQLRSMTPSIENLTGNLNSQHQSSSGNSSGDEISANIQQDYYRLLVELIQSHLS
jgi:hypothetical protein